MHVVVLLHIIESYAGIVLYLSVVLVSLVVAELLR
jgi:hypothetical protein